MSLDMAIEDQNVPYAHSPGGTPQEDEVENVWLLSHSNDKAPLQENRQQVMLELIDASSPGERLGLDLVVVLDISGSMEGDRLIKVKTAMQFVIKKLSPIDRLSIVIFSDKAERLCQLRSVTKASQAALKGLIRDLIVIGNTNIRDGLEIGHKVLADRRRSGGRVASIFLLSDGDQNIGDATIVDVSDVAIYTFGFGAQYDPKVLEEIARKSKGGTFNYVADGENMTEPFSQILGGLLSVVVQDLKLTVSPQPGDSTIEKVDAGLYLQTKDANAGSVTVSFGDLFAGEVRKVIVDIHLPAVDVHRTKSVIAISQCSYSIQGKPFFSSKLTVTISRLTGSAADPNAMKPEAVRAELARRRHANYLEEACTMADRKDFYSANNKLVEAKNDLLKLEQSNSMIDILRSQLDKLLQLIRNLLPGLLAFLRSLKTSHDRQRVAATGNVKGVRLFETPLMGLFQGQAEEFVKRPTMELPSVDHDFEEVKKRVRGEVGIQAEPPPVDHDFKEVTDQAGMDLERPAEAEELPPVDHDFKEVTDQAGMDLERPAAAMADRSSLWAWVMAILCTVLAMADRSSRWAWVMVMLCVVLAALLR